MRFLITTLLIAFVPAFVYAAGPTCALLDPEKNARVALLEAKLLADDSATWVERADIDKVLKEQKLQAIFSPQGVGERVQLGKLLKADVLVMVRSVKDAESPTLEVVISETASGLRLMLRGVSVTKSTNDDVAALLATVKDGLKRHGEKISEILAVPPFMSNDLEFTHDYLKGALAKLAEAEALGRKGVVVVELAEAEALAKEITLTTPGARVNRSLPVYLMGEYRNEGKGKDRTISLKLRTEQGGKALGKATELKVKAGEESAAVRKWAAEQLDVLAKDDKPRPPADPKVESKQLAERAKIFASLGYWADSLALIEASLLLEPKQVDIRVEAIRAITHRMRQLWNPFSPTLDEVRKVHPLFSRGLEHFEVAISRHNLFVDKNGHLGNSFLHVGNNLIHTDRNPDPAVVNELADMRRERREVMLCVLPTLVKRGELEEVTPVSVALIKLSVKERCQLVEELVIQFQDFPKTETRTSSFLTSARPNTTSERLFVPADAAEYEALLERLAASKNASVRKGVAGAKALWQAEVDKLKRGTPTASVAEESGVILNPFKLSGMNNQVAGIFPVGQKLDVVWDRSAVYVMKEKGKVQRIWPTKPIRSDLEFVAPFFDGKYFWISVVRHQEWGTILVVDPVAEKAWELTAADGLPQGQNEQLKTLYRHILLASPLGPGRVCVAGTFGRAWIAIVTFDSKSGKAEVKVIHEAKEAQDGRNKDQAERATVDFVPQFMFTIRGKSAAGRMETRVVLGRGISSSTPNAALKDRPLLIDPENRSVEVVKKPWPGLSIVNHDQFGVKEDAAYYFGRIQEKPDSKIFCVSFPDLIPKPVAERLSGASGSLVIDDKRLHIFQFAVTAKSLDGRVRNFSRWSTVDTDGKNFQLLSSKMPNVKSVWHSSHYGLVAVADVPNSSSPSFNTVEFATVPPKK